MDMKKLVHMSAVAALLAPSWVHGQRDGEDTRSIMAIIVELEGNRQLKGFKGNKGVELRASGPRGPLTNATPVPTAEVFARTVNATIIRFERAISCPDERPVHIAECRMDDALTYVFAFSPVTFTGDEARVSTFLWQRSSQHSGLIVGRSNYTLVRTEEGWVVTRVEHTSHVPT